MAAGPHGASVVATRKVGDKEFSIVAPLPQSLSQDDLLQALDDPGWDDADHVFGWLQDRLFEVTARHFDVGPGSDRSEHSDGHPFYAALLITERPD